MATAYITHPLFLQHEMGSSHPESPARLQVLEQQLKSTHLYERLQHYSAQPAEREAILRVHHADYLAQLEQRAPREGLVWLDPDTAMNPYSLQAAFHAAGAGMQAVDLVMSREVQTAFCAVRPPGHHAEPGRAMGFCLLNNIAIAAAHALAGHGLQRVAIIDFDVHHGNGTEAMFRGDERVLFCSSFQHPFYPGTQLSHSNSNIVHAPLTAGADSGAFRSAYLTTVIPAVERFAPELILVSAGFDAHQSDGMSGVQLIDEDYTWVSEQIIALAERHCQGRVVSLLEGGYTLPALGRCAAEHIRVLLESS